MKLNCAVQTYTPPSLYIKGSKLNSTVRILSSLLIIISPPDPITLESCLSRTRTASVSLSISPCSVQVMFRLLPTTKDPSVNILSPKLQEIHFLLMDRL